MTENPTRGAVSAASASRTQSAKESHDHSIRRSRGSGKHEQMRSITLSTPNLSQ